MLNKRPVSRRVHKGMSAQPGDTHSGPEEAGSGHVALCRAGAPRLARPARRVWALSAAWERPPPIDDLGRYLTAVLALPLLGQRPAIIECPLCSRYRQSLIP